jgi:hypothetical protein
VSGTSIAARIVMNESQTRRWLFAIAAVLGGIACGGSDADPAADEEAPNRRPATTTLDGGDTEGGEAPPSEGDPGPSVAAPDGGADAAALRDRVGILLTNVLPGASASLPTFVNVLQDAKNCNVFGKNCDQDVEFWISIDAPATAAATTPVCSRRQGGTGLRDCTQNFPVGVAADLAVGDTIAVRLRAIAYDPGADPECSIVTTWRYEGAGQFALQGGPVPPAATGWQCTGKGSGQDLKVLLNYALAGTVTKAGAQ